MVSKSLLITPLLLAASLLTATEANALATDAVASYYGSRFHGRLTASGQPFNMNRLTAAHRTLKFGTRVLVTNKANGRTVEVTINDRGPYIKGRSIDLSKGAAKALGMLGSGVARVELKVVDGGNSLPKRPEKLSIAQAQHMMMELF
ncbi:septal ring lytic transglycosylase RlpA family protein [Thiorhodococcus mannitoliphagus]|uniref:Endolytic peptidoglycan transglycosylase RlpA n=1 Tax=Thiorhodococcus mannitoliphagus TaxID=329406 RepID=A0A6P1E0S2_9GAMM|nr:septal ring lytic transglycosylase RlpA family protein [Thiorhodococcus mannitoliphagus]NEX22843.1 septal ring lytic transglycosylase RlpA family protein [Thiorhodococcus mannitoliphagus]